jgi:hypothetical protein
MPVAWCLASPQIGEREAAAELLAHATRTGALRPGLTLIGDKGFAGRDFQDLVSSGFGLHLVRPDRRGEPARHGSIGWIRQWIESVHDTLKGRLDLERHGGRTAAGVYARTAQRLLAMGRLSCDDPRRYGVGSLKEPPKMSELPNVAAQFCCGAGGVLSGPAKVSAGALSCPRRVSVAPPGTSGWVPWLTPGSGARLW